MKIVLEPSQPFNLDLTLCCGQAFRWEKFGEWWYGTIKNKPLKVRQTGNVIEFENANSNLVKTYFGLSDDLSLILSKITKDRHIGEAVKTLRGLRILRQDPWECLISYICATYKNIPAIKRMLHNLSKRFGERTVLDGYPLYAFPTAENLAKVSLRQLAECGLGYRAKYVYEAAKKVVGGQLKIEELKKEDYESVREKLLTLKGVGLKVADCVALFSLEKLEAFPVDVWIKRVMIRHYANHFEKEFIREILFKKSLTRADYEKLGLFGRKYFGAYAGYAQEYLFHFERMAAKQSRTS
ncbi:MAG: DNA glycosylase [Candidatus Bathyarchaeia archaeon]